MRRKLAFKLSDEPVRRGEVLFVAAQIARERLGKVEFAIDLAEQALRADPGAIGALDFVAAVLVGREDWPLLAKSYEAVLEKLQDEPVALDLARKTALVCRDKLKDGRRAARALERAAAIEPTDTRLLAELCDLLVSTGQHEDASRYCQSLLRLQPRVDAHYRRALVIYKALNCHDQAWSAAHALDYLGDADINESLHSDMHRPDGLLPVIQGLSDEEWASGALNPDRDVAIQTLLTVIAEPAVELQMAVLAKAKQLLEPDPKLRVESGDQHYHAGPYLSLDLATTGARTSGAVCLCGRSRRTGDRPHARAGVPGQQDPGHRSRATGARIPLGPPPHGAAA